MANNLDGIDPSLVASIKADLQNPDKQKGVDPALLKSIRTDFGMSLSDKPNTYDEEQYANQHPIANAVEGVANSGLIKGINSGISGVANGIDSAVNATPGGNTMAGLIIPIKTANFLSQEGQTLGKRSDTLLTKPQPGQSADAFESQQIEGNRLGRLGTLLNNHPLPHSAGEAVVSTAISALGELPSSALFARNSLLSKTANFVGEHGSTPMSPMEGVLRKSGNAVRNILDEPGLEKAVRKDTLNATTGIQNDLFNTNKQIDLVQKSVEKINQDTSRIVADMGTAQRVPDYGELGSSVKKNISTVADADKTPLIEKRNTLTDYATRYSQPEPPVLVTEAAKPIASDLAGVIDISKDNTVKKLINKYTDVVEKSKLAEQYSGKPLDETIFGQKKALTIKGLQEDSTRLGGIWKDMREGNPKQARAVYALRELVEDEIQRRMDLVDPEISKEYSKNRSNFKQHYDTFGSDTARAIRNADGSEVPKKVFDSPESVSQAQKIMSPSAWENLKAIKTREIVNELEKSRDPVGRISKATPGYYERIYGTEGAAQLEDFARNLPKIKELSDQLGKLRGERESLGNKPIGDFLNKELRGKLGRIKAGEEASSVPDIVRRAASASFSSAFLYTHHPWLSVASASIGLAPEAIARAYVKAGPSMRATIDGLVRERAMLGPGAPTKNVPIVAAFIKREGVSDAERTKE